MCIPAGEYRYHWSWLRLGEWLRREQCSLIESATLVASLILDAFVVRARPLVVLATYELDTLRYLDIFRRPWSERPMSRQLSGLC